MRIGISIVLTFIVAGSLHAQIDSGPAVGGKMEALKAFVATGDDAGKEVDYAAERKAKPTIFVFVQADKWDRPAARFLKTMDKDLSVKDAHIVAVWLTDDVDKAKAYLPKAQQSLQMEQTTFAVFPGDQSGPAGWGINLNAHVTAVVTQNQKVIASFGYRSLNETDVPAVLKKLKADK